MQNTDNYERQKLNKDRENRVRIMDKNFSYIFNIKLV